MVRTGAGWGLQVAGEATDVGRAEQAAAAGLEAFGGGRFAYAGGHLRTALDLIGPDPLPDVTGAWFHGARERLRAWETDLRIVAAEADLRAGHTLRALADLDLLCRRLPDREDLAVARIRALAELRRTDEALDACADAARTVRSGVGRTGDTAGERAQVPPPSELDQARAELLAAPLRPAGAPRLRFEVLGRLTIEIGAHVVVPDEIHRDALVVLLLRHGRAVPAAELLGAIDHAHADDPRAHADAVRTLVTELRAALGVRGPLGRLLRTTDTGAVIEVLPDELDLTVAERHVVAGARAAGGAGRRTRPPPSGPPWTSSPRISWSAAPARGSTPNAHGSRPGVRTSSRPGSRPRPPPAAGRTWPPRPCAAGSTPPRSGRTSGSST